MKYIQVQVPVQGIKRSTEPEKKRTRSSETTSGKTSGRERSPKQKVRLDFSSDFSFVMSMFSALRTFENLALKIYSYVYIYACD
jgi:hypothetical protein